MSRLWCWVVGHRYKLRGVNRGIYDWSPCLRCGRLSPSTLWQREKEKQP